MRISESEGRREIANSADADRTINFRGAYFAKGHCTRNDEGGIGSSAQGFYVFLFQERIRTSRAFIDPASGLSPLAALLRRRPIRCASRATGGRSTNGQAMGQPYRPATRTSDNAGALEVQ
jgi:hypothetical protein